jgi:hypothetical protein
VTLALLEIQFCSNNIVLTCDLNGTRTKPLEICVSTE